MKLEDRIKMTEFWDSEYEESMRKGIIKGHKLINQYWTESIHRGKFETLVSRYANDVEQWIRFLRVFKRDELWQKIRPSCDKHLKQFVQDCDMLCMFKNNINQEIKEYDVFFEETSAEKIVINFACWLEKKYFNDNTEFNYSDNILDYRNVLQECLIRCGNTKSCSLEQINEMICGTFQRIKEERKLERVFEQLFETVLDWLKLDFYEEMFCSQGWVFLRENNCIHIKPPTEESWERIEIPRWKYFIEESFELGTPFSPKERDYIDDVNKNSPNFESAQMNIYSYFSYRYFVRSFGNNILAKMEAQFGAQLKKILRTLFTPIACYTNTYIEPRKKAKEEGKNYIDAIIPCALYEPNELIKLAYEKKWEIFRFCVEGRELNSFAEKTSKFYKGSISYKEAKTALDAFTVDIRDKKSLDLVKGQEFLLLRNQDGYLFITRLFFSYPHVVWSIFALIFNKNDKEVASYFECRIVELFKQLNFRVISNYAIKNDGYQGEIDVLAFRDNTLFVIEAKMVCPRLFVHNIRTLHEKFEKAGTQLNGTLDQLSDIWSDISGQLNITKTMEQVKVVTLVVSNSFEYDHQHFNSHLKISFHELEVVLQEINPLEIYLLRQQLLYRKRNIILSSNLPSEQQIEQYRLFRQDKVTVSQILECIEQSRYWQHVLDQPFTVTPIFTVDPVDTTAIL